eukprot:COSAG06_NODE_24746_length_653_cov_1.481949_1_plen_148_part_10
MCTRLVSLATGEQQLDRRCAALDAMMIAVGALALVVSGVAGEAVAGGQARALQEDSCPCTKCVSAMGNSVDDCQSLGLDCSCFLDCRCQRCVTAMGNSVADCESLGLDCSCYGGGAGGGGGACDDLADRAAAVNDECCDEPAEDCSSG